MVLGASLAGLACAILAVVVVLGFNQPAVHPSSLAEEMDRLATVAGDQDFSGIPGVGQYLFTDAYGVQEPEHAVGDTQCILRQPFHVEMWVAANGSGAQRQTTSPGTFVSTADKNACLSIHVTNPFAHGYQSEYRFGSGKHDAPVSSHDWRKYSTNPQLLLKQIHRGDGGQNTPEELLVNVADYLRFTDAPPTIRAALYRATLLIPGVRLLGMRTDPKGQRGIAVSCSRGRLRYEVFFDAANSRLLADAYSWNGKQTTWLAYTRQELVTGLPAGLAKHTRRH